MSRIIKGQLSDISQDFVQEDLRYKKDDPYYFRNLQTDSSKFSSLSSRDIEILVKNNNTAENWDKVLVSADFDPTLVRNCDFWGMVRLGNLTASFLEYNQLRLPVGLNNCTIISCDIGDNVVLRNVHFLSHYIIGDECILFNIDEMITTDNARFGNGIIKEGEEENIRIWLEIGNENGGRKVLPFIGILPADAYLWSKYRDDEQLMQRFVQMTDQLGDTRRGYYGVVGRHSVIKNSRIIKNTSIGSNCYIKGANKLKNLSILSTQEEPTQIGEGCELVNGIIGLSNNIFYGVKAVRFVTGSNVQLKYGARLINSVLGSNSNISCCEVLNNLIFPFHEQHHNNSFLIASTVMGQSNIAAGATIGSNHNSRAADGEIIAKRGFWPGLLSNFKHNSYFSSFSLIAKGNYYNELNITLPFALVSMGDDPSTIRLFPGFWFRHNMYALIRNAWKFKSRDKRKTREQMIETDFLAPDTVEEMFQGIEILHEAIRKALNKKITLEQIVKNESLDKELELKLDHIIYKGKAIVHKPVQSIRLYQMMIFHYGALELIKWLSANKDTTDFSQILAEYEPPERIWHNIGGQLITDSDLNRILDDVKTEQIESWNILHRRYYDLWQDYPRQRRNHAIFSLLQVEQLSPGELTAETIKTILAKEKEIIGKIEAWTFESREKDYSNEFRKITFRNEKELEAVLGSISNNSFLIDFKKENDYFCTEIDRLISRL